MSRSKNLSSGREIKIKNDPKSQRKLKCGPSYSFPIAMCHVEMKSKGEVYDPFNLPLQFGEYGASM